MSPLAQLCDAVEEMFAARAALEVAPTSHNRIFDAAMDRHSEALKRLSAELAKARATEISA